MVYQPLCIDLRKILRVAQTGLLVPVTINSFYRIKIIRKIRTITRFPNYVSAIFKNFGAIRQHMNDLLAILRHHCVP